MTTIPTSNPYFMDFHPTTGAPLVGGKLYTLKPGTSTPKSVYLDGDFTVAGENPVILDAYGRRLIHCISPTDFVLKDPDDVQIWGPITTGQVNNFVLVNPTDEIINTAIQEVDEGDRIHLYGTPVLNDTVVIDRPVSVLGYGFGGVQTAPVGCIIDASAVVGTAIRITKGAYASLSEIEIGGFQLVCGDGVTPSTVTKGIDIQTWCPRWRLRKLRVTGATASQDGLGGSYGIYAGGANGNYSAIMEEVYCEYNDIGAYLGDTSQNTVLRSCAFARNYTWGLQIQDTACIGLENLLLENNGKIADTTGSLKIDNSTAIDIYGGSYGEQLDVAVWPGCVMLIGPTAVVRGLTIGSACRFSTPNAPAGVTKGMIINRIRDSWNYGLFFNFATPISYEPGSNYTGIVNFRDMRRHTSTTSSQTSPPINSLSNIITDPFLNVWTNPTTITNWTKSTRGTTNRSTDAGKIGDYCVELVGDGVAGEVSISQAVSAINQSLIGLSGRCSMRVKIKVPTANTDALTPKIHVGSNVYELDESDDALWYQFGIAAASPTTVKFSLCQAGETALATDAIYIYAVEVYPGTGLPEGPQ